MRRAVPRAFIIAVDGGSTDGSYEWLQSHADLTFRQRRKGIGEARQQGFKLVEGPWMVTFDADVTFPPDWLDVVKRYAAPRVAVVSGYIVYGEGSTAQYYRALYRCQRTRSNTGYVTFGNNLVRTEAMRQIGGFSTIPSGEDKAAWLTLRGRGWKWVNVTGLEANNQRTHAEDLAHNRWWGRSVVPLYPNPFLAFGSTFIRLLYLPYMAQKKVGGLHLLHVFKFLEGYMQGWREWRI